MRPHFLHNDANYGVNFLNTTTYVSLLSVGCAWFVSRLHHTFIARTNPKTLYVVVVVVVSHIQRIGYQPEKNYFTRWPIPLVVC